MKTPLIPKKDLPEKPDQRNRSTIVPKAHEVPEGFVDALGADHSSTRVSPIIIRARA